ncbi:MAG: hypothetical protein MUD12_10710 [Spirochaetes bacterium]|jgi:hypothetical protein|nr:hypothetical protein [Spirochaetota bacterium]
MSYLLYFLGLVIGFIAFIYILRAYESGKGKIKSLSGGTSRSVEPKNVTVAKNNFLERHPGERMCPVCATRLSRYEVLYATQVDTDTGPKILIHGCGYCYKPEVKKTERDGG